VKKLAFLTIVALFSLNSFSQSEGQLHGSFQLDAQYYANDSLIGAVVPKELTGINSYANFNYTKGAFKAGIRYETYLPPLNGFDSRYRGQGIPYMYASYMADGLEVTVGNFYEQFGSGLILRSYEEKNLGYDNAFNGISVRYAVTNGIMVKALMGSQRSYWDNKGNVKGVDGEFSLNQLIPCLKESKTNITLGSSFVSKYQTDNSSLYYLPENVGASAYRLQINRGKVAVSGEYAIKINDPSSDNGFIYKNGEALVFNASFSQKGLGVLLTAKRIDNMSFRADRSALISDLNINYVPDITRVHTYSLASMYPYATQLKGEAGIRGEVNYTFKKESLLGGKSGTFLSVNYTRMANISKEAVNDTIKIGEPGTLGYSASAGNYFSELFSDDLFYQDLNFELTKKISKKFKGVFTYINHQYNNDIVHGANSVETQGIIKSNIFIADITYKHKPRTAYRLELEHLSTKEDYGNWAAAMLEISVPQWFFTLINLYNYGNPIADQKLHYPKVAVGYNRGANTFTIAYGRQKAGVVCVGGVCRAVPASSGLSLSIVSSF
jgi:hypothetical protein